MQAYLGLPEPRIQTTGLEEAPPGKQGALTLPPLPPTTLTMGESIGLLRMPSSKTKLAFLI